MKKFKEVCSNFWNDEEGIQTLEILLIVAVIVFIALMFRKNIEKWIKDLVGYGDDHIKDFDPGS
ncbi:MAG TPA: Flp1 family type IVb pilin [Virgibacillus sp.]|nr:Flp1 family type IVb pilin [Virgibacillus sp.]